MNNFFSVSPGWGIWLTALILAYLSILLFKESRRHRDDIRNALIVAAFLLLPAITAELFVYGGDLTGAFNPDLPANRDAAHWWVVQITPEGEEAWFLNLLAALITFSALYVVVSFVVALLPALTLNRKRIELLSLHRALIKWPVVITGFVLFLDINLWPLLLGMGAVSVVLGFALKEMLENLFTGMVLDTEGAFSTGDWIRLGDSDTVGKVYEKHWRSTKVLTTKGESVTIPNRLLGTEKILTFNKPQLPFACTLKVGTSYDDPPVKVKEVLRTILIREPEVVSEPAPWVRTVSYSDFSIDYEMRFWIEDYGRMLTICDSIMTKVWYAFKFYAIQIPFPVRTQFQISYDQMNKMQAALEDEVAAKRDFLKSLSFFAGHLDFSDFEYLARNSFSRRFKPGDRIVQKGEIGDALYLVTENFCEVTLPDGRKPRIESGHYFGEMGLLGDHRRMADVCAGENGATVMRIDRHCMEFLFRAHPDLLREFKLVRDARKDELAKEIPPSPASQPAPVLRALRYMANFLWPW